MPALPAEGILFFDLRSAFRTCFDSRRRRHFFLRDDHRRWLGFFTLRNWSGQRRWCCLYRRWLCNWRNDGVLLLLLFLDYVESSGSDERPAVIGRSDKRGLKNLHIARIRIGTVIVVLVELVKVTFRRELRRSRQYECLILIGDDYKLAVFDRHKYAGLVIK